MQPRLLILLNPGKQSRFYLLGLARAAGRLGVPAVTLELGEVWAQLAGRETTPRVIGELHVRLEEIVRRQRISHVLGYAHNPVDFGPGHDRDGRIVPVFERLGLVQLLLWTDHPNWAPDAVALRDPGRRLLGHPRQHHFLKSEAAAREAAEVLGWPNCHALAMAEDDESYKVGKRCRPVHDAVLILGGAAALPDAAARRLDDPDPDPRGIDAEMAEPALRSIDKFLRHQPDAALHDSIRACAASLLEAKRANPTASYWRLCASLAPGHAAALAWLKADPRRWYNATASLRRMVEWRRFFWPAWLARRANVGVYGCDASSLGIPQTPRAGQWVEYADQASVYALGGVALNINAAHDEEGCTHKPFQIAASGSACIHHDTNGLQDLFIPGEEILAYSRGPALLEAVRSLGANPSRGQELGERMRARALKDHTWEARLSRMLALASGWSDLAQEQSPTRRGAPILRAL